MNYITYAISEASKQIEGITESSLDIHNRLLCKNIVMSNAAYDGTLTCLYRAANNIFIEPQHRMNAYLCCLTTKLSNLDDVLKSELSSSSNITSFSEDSIHTDFVNVAGTLELNVLESDEKKTIELLSAFISNSLNALLGKTSTTIPFTTLSNNVELLLNSQYFNTTYDNMLIDFGFMQNKNYYGLAYLSALEDDDTDEDEDDATDEEIIAATNTAIQNILYTNSFLSVDGFSFAKDAKYIVKVTGRPTDLPSGQRINNYDYIIVSPTGNVTLDEITTDIITIHSGSNSTLVNAFDILHAISMFLNRLKNIKIINIKLKYKTTQIATQVKASGKYNVIYNEYGEAVTDSADIVTGKKATLGISPYSEIVIPDINEDIVFNNVSKIKKYSSTIATESGIETVDDRSLAVETNETNNTAIVFPYLVYDMSSGASTEKIIPLDYNGTNGCFASELVVKKYNNFELTINDIKEQFNIVEGNVIKRKDVLNAIDYIFTYWIENMSTIDYLINVCHSNCHANSVSITIGESKSYINTFEVAVKLPMYYTGGCNCGLLTTNSYNIKDLVPKRHLSSFKKFTGNLSAELVIGTLYSDSDQPDSITVAGYLFKEAPNTRINSGKQVIPVAAPTAGGTVTVSAGVPSDIRKTKKYFCLAVWVYAKYEISIPGDDEEDEEDEEDA